ncbi:hypothetical protein ACI780_06870 [Geodermatophilus sp. SYSU D00814]
MSSASDEAAIATLQVSADGSDWRDVSAPVRSVDIEDHDRLTDKATVVLDDDTGLLADLSFEGLVVRLAVGWQAEQAPIFEGVVTSTRVLAQPTGQRVELTALDFTYRMTLRPYQPGEWQPGEKLSAVLGRIVGRPEYRITARQIEPADDVTMSTTRPVAHAGLNEWEFVLDQARRQGCLAFLEFDGKDASKFYFVPVARVASAEPIGTLRYCRGIGELIEFRYERIATGALPVRAASSIDPATGEPVEQPAPAPRPREPLPPPATGRQRDVDAGRRAAVEALAELSAAATAKIEPRRQQVTGRPSAGADALAAQVTSDPTRELGLNGQGVSVGTVQLRAKSRVLIQGVAPWAEGAWYVTKVNHVYTRERVGQGTRSSYYSKFTATR